MVNANHEAVKRVEAFFAEYGSITYKKCELILRADEAPFGVYFLKTGYVRQYLLTPGGETFIVHIYKPGSFFPLTWIVSDVPNVYHFEATTSVTIIRAPKDAFVDFLKRHEDALFYAMQRLSLGLAGFVSRVAQLVLDDARTKTILLALYYAENFGEKTNEGVELAIPLTHREIAAWIGTTRETASLQVETLVKQGLVKTKGRHLIIPDVTKLRAAVSRR